MQIIKLDATHSTNLYLKKLSVEKQLEDFTIVVTENQFEGRGQRGAVWQSEKGKNLTFSIFKRIGDLAIRHQFAIGMCTALAVYNCLDEHGVPDLRVKWPNDIMSGQKKICGILIENTFASGTIKSAIIGIGLNVNQTNFDGMEKASSLKLVCNKSFDLDELMTGIAQKLYAQFAALPEKGFNRLQQHYEAVLFRKDKPSTFKGTDGVNFSGIIRGISDTGKLNVEIEGRKMVAFDLKEIAMMLN